MVRQIVLTIVSVKTCVLTAQFLININFPLASLFLWIHIYLYKSLNYYPRSHSSLSWPLNRLFAHAVLTVNQLNVKEKFTKLGTDLLCDYMPILLVVLHTFPKVLTNRIWLTFNSFKWRSHSLFSWPKYVIQGRYCREKLHASHSRGGSKVQMFSNFVAITGLLWSVVFVHWKKRARNATL